MTLRNDGGECILKPSDFQAIDQKMHLIQGGELGEDAGRKLLESLGVYINNDGKMIITNNDGVKKIEAANLAPEEDHSGANEKEVDVSITKGLDEVCAYQLKQMKEEAGVKQYDQIDHTKNDFNF